MILITGTSGFIGKHLLESLIRNYGVDKILALTSEAITNCRYLLHNNYSFSSNFFLDNGFESIETVIHVGAFTPKNKSQSNDWENCNKNIKNTDILLRSELPNLKRVVYLSTLDVYGKDEIITEESPLLPATLYGESKLYCEKMVSAWAHSENKISQILRIGHVYGPGEEKYGKIIPETMKRLVLNQPLEIWGSGSQKRAFIYINDVISAILKSLDLGKDIGPVNLVSGNTVSVRKLVNKIITISGKTPIINTVESNIPAKDLIFNSTKMKRYLLSSETKLDVGLLDEWKYMQSL